MELVNSLNQITQPYTNAVITIGNFDGVHIGHQALFHQVIEKADAIGGTSIAMTFEPHPLRVLKKNGHPPLITLNEQKVELISNSSLDVLICLPFTKSFAAITAREFVEDLLVKKIGMKAIVIGEDYTFGKNREGNLTLLKSLAHELGFEVIVLDWIPVTRNHKARISSTKIRQMVMDGRVEDVPKLLGRNYQIRGKVAKGRDRGGKLLGCPTANINLQDELCPKNGVYAVTVECLGAKYKGVANIGYSPTFGDRIFTVEVHILDFEGDLYNEKIRVNFVKRIRGEIKFSGISELSKQIQKDIQVARDILSL
jgi:riboflavin kinase/FMN adenylyltransferase